MKKTNFKTKAFLLKLLILLITLFHVSTQQNCENQCNECQRIVYQMKFQNYADCSFSSCRNTVCYQFKFYIVYENFRNMELSLKPF
jgi:hypothetical protein